MSEPRAELYAVYLFYHPSCDHMDPSADIREDFFTLSTSMVEASSKVITDIKRKRGSKSYYEHSAGCISLSKDITPEQGLSVLKAAGLRVVE